MTFFVSFSFCTYRAIFVNCPAYGYGLGFAEARGPRLFALFGFGSLNSSLIVYFPCRCPRGPKRTGQLPQLIVPRARWRKNRIPFGISSSSTSRRSRSRSRTRRQRGLPTEEGVGEDPLDTGEGGGTNRYRLINTRLHHGTSRALGPLATNIMTRWTILVCFG